MGNDRTRTGTSSDQADLTVSIVVPWRDKGDEHRRKNFDHVIDYLRGLNLGTVVIAPDGRSGNEPFNRSAAFNRGRADHPADVYIWHEADMLIPADQLRAGIARAAGQAGLVVPFTRYHYLSPEDTDRVRGGEPVTSCVPEWVMPDGKSIGAVGITSEATMQMVGQWDETFHGWGFDDNAMFRAFAVCAGTAWIDGPAWHCYHTPGWSPEVWATKHSRQVPEAERLATEANRQRLGLYEKARTPEDVRRLTVG